MKKKVLIVDDSLYMRTVMKNILSDAGYQIIGEAGNGASAIKMVEELPDLLTLDLILPDSTGLEVLKEVKGKYPQIKVVVISAVGQESIVNQAMELGAQAYIVKPFAEDKVVDIVNNVFEN